MKNILRILFITTLFSFFLQSCRDDNETSWKTATPSFKLFDTSLGGVVLYPTMENNPFQLVWDNVTDASGDFSIVYSKTSDFKTKDVLGTSKINSFSTTVGAFNTALLRAGYSPYSTEKVFVRIEQGDKVSNSISFDVQPYPSVAPVITAPVAGAEILLSGDAPDDVITTFTWLDYNTYGVNVTYLLEVSKKGANNFSTLGSVMNAKSFEATNKVLNDAVLKAGLEADVKGEVDIRVTATTKSTGGTIEKVSNIVTFKVTPYVAFKNLFLVGDATAAGWSTNNNNQAVYRDPVNVNKFYFTGKFGTSMFKLIETLGVDTWQPQWGLKSGSVANSDGGEPNPFTISSSGYYSFEIDILAKTYSLTSYADSMTNYSTIGLIGGFNGWGGDLALSQSSFDSHQWSLKGVAFPAGEVKFRAEGSWSVSWGPTAALQSVSTLSGVGVKQDGQNINLEAGTYDVYFNDIDGRYQFIKK